MIVDVKWGTRVEIDKFIVKIMELKTTLWGAWTYAKSVLSINWRRKTVDW